LAKIEATPFLFSLLVSPLISSRVIFRYRFL
jgi:hypothetical protein